MKPRPPVCKRRSDVKTMNKVSLSVGWSLKIGSPRFVEAYLMKTAGRDYASQQLRFQKKYGRWAVVAGASDGIGREMSLRIAESGLNVVLVARRRDRLEDIAQSIQDRFAVGTLVLACDLSDESAIASVVDKTSKLDVGLLIAAAGFGTSGQFIRADLRAEIEMVNVNCRALMMLSYHFGQRFAAQRRGGIVLMSSLLAFQGVPNAANYAATKAYVQSLAEGLHFELAPFGVDVIASAPGPVYSGFAARANMKMGMGATPESVAQATLNALGRWTTVRPGFLSKFLEATLVPLTRWGRIQMLGVIMRGMTNHQPAL
jgi:short-subunit dehydrogenase